MSSSSSPASAADMQEKNTGGLMAETHHDSNSQVEPSQDERLIYLFSVLNRRMRLKECKGGYLFKNKSYFFLGLSEVFISDQSYGIFSYRKMQTHNKFYPNDPSPFTEDKTFFVAAELNKPQEKIPEGKMPSWIFAHNVGSSQAMFAIDPLSDEVKKDLLVSGPSKIPGMGSLIEFATKLAAEITNELTNNPIDPSTFNYYRRKTLEDRTFQESGENWSTEEKRVARIDTSIAFLAVLRIIANSEQPENIISIDKNLTYPGFTPDTIDIFNIPISISTECKYGQFSKECGCSQFELGKMEISGSWSSFSDANFWDYIMNPV